MSLFSQHTSARITQLRLRCEVERQQLGDAIAEIEQRFQSIDGVLGSVKRTLTRPGFIFGALSLLAFGRRKLKLFSKVRKGLFWFATGRRLYQMFRKSEAR